MADPLKIKSGTRMQIAFDVPLDKDPVFELVCTFNKVLDESAFLISVPMKDGKPLAFDDTRKLLIKYNMSTEPMIIAGYADDEVKEGIRRYWKIRRVTEQRSFFKRADERVKVPLKVSYTRAVKLPGEKDRGVESGMTLDISAGGMALFLNDTFDVGELINVTLPRVGTSPEGKSIPDIPSVVCWLRDAPRGSLYRRLAGFQYRLSEPEKKEMSNYVNNVKKKYKI